MLFTKYETDTRYGRQVTEDTDGVRGRNWHYHELNPVLNRKRVLDAFRNCAEAPRSHACRHFIAFAQPRALLMEGRPARLVFQTRTWDFDADLDKEFSCDAMETYTFYVAAGRVEHRAAACDYIDWTTTGASSRIWGRSSIARRRGGRVIPERLIELFLVSYS